MRVWKYSVFALVLLILTSCAAQPTEEAPAETPPPEVPAGPPGLAERGLTTDDFPRVHQLAENVYTFETLGRNYGTNSLIVVTSDGVLVADGQGNPETVTRLVAEVNNLTDQPIRYVVVASEHGDHTGGNSAFPEGTTFIAHPNSQAALETQANNPERDADAPPIVVPTETVSDSRTLMMGDTDIEVLHLGRAHTGGDLMVYLPESRILFMSESYFSGQFPALRTGYAAEWIQALERAEAMDVAYYVPGHGFVDDPETLAADVPQFRMAVQSVLSEAQRLYDPERSAEEAFPEADFGPYAQRGTFELFAPLAFARVWEEVAGNLD
jgi:cyclase